MTPRQPIQTGFTFGSGFTPLGKKLLILYAAVYVAELIFFHWFRIPRVSLLFIHPLGHPDFHLFQILTHPFVHDPTAPLSFLIHCLVFYFFSAPVERAVGGRGFLTLFFGAAAGSALCGMGFSLMADFAVPFGGMLPSLLALIVVFGLLNPDATILLMFIIPIKARYISYGTLLITLLTFLAKANPNGAYHLGGILFGWLWLAGPRHALDYRRLHMMYLEWKLKRKKARFRVIDGDKDKDRPTYH